MQSYEVCDLITNKSLGVITFADDLLSVIEAFCTLSSSIYLVKSNKTDSALEIESLDAFLHWLKSVN